MILIFEMLITLGALIGLALVVADQRERGCAVFMAAMLWAVITSVTVMLGWLSAQNAWFIR